MWRCLQDEHILARKFADRWMAQALGVGLFKRRLYRKEVEDTRQVLYSTINPLAKVCTQAPVCNPCPQPTALTLFSRNVAICGAAPHADNVTLTAS